MSAQQKVMEYAKTKANGMDLQKFVVEMQGGMVINRTPSSITIATLSRQGKEIAITEKTIAETKEIVNGKLIFGKSESAVEVLRVSL